jgi:hypothetical protein
VSFCCLHRYNSDWRDNETKFAGHSAKLPLDVPKVDLALLAFGVPSDGGAFDEFFGGKCG